MVAAIAITPPVDRNGTRSSAEKTETNSQESAANREDTALELTQSNSRALIADRQAITKAIMTAAKIGYGVARAGTELSGGMVDAMAKGWLKQDDKSVSTSRSKPHSTGEEKKNEIPEAEMSPEKRSSEKEPTNTPSQRREEDELEKQSEALEVFEADTSYTSEVSEAVISGTTEITTADI